MRYLSAIFAVIVICASSVFAKFEEWPQWLGPRGDGISTDPIAEKWAAGGPAKLWDQKVGLGYSRPIGFDEKVYLFSQNGNLDALTAFDADSGKVLWSQSYPCTIKADQGQAKNPNNSLPLPLATPCIEGDRIYT